jgi:hypothetical protein
MAADELYAGDVGFTQGDDSLAGAIEQGLDEALRDYGLPGLPAEGRADRTAFILGIARGIVSYLVDHEQAFTIAPGDGLSHTHSGHVVIQEET